MSNKGQASWKGWIILPYWHVLYYSALVAFFLGIWLLNVLALPLFFLKTSTFTKKTIQFFIKILTKIYVETLRFTRELHVTFPRSEFIDQIQPSILIANHPSSFDAPIILSRVNRITCIFKAALKKNLLLSNTTRLAGFIPNDLGIDTIKQAHMELNGGSHILIFPEGTRTVSNPINPLNTSFLLIARRAKVPVRFITIHTKSNLMGKGQHFLKLPTLPSKFNFRVGPEFTFSFAQSISKLAQCLKAYYEYQLTRQIEDTVFYSLWPKSLSFNFQPNFLCARLSSADLQGPLNTEQIRILTNEWLLAFGFIYSEIDGSNLKTISNLKISDSALLTFEFHFKKSDLVQLAIKENNDKILCLVEFPAVIQE